MAILGVNIRHDVAMARQNLASAAAAPLKAFKAALEDAAKKAAAGPASSCSTAVSAGMDMQKLNGKLNEAVAVSFVAPLLADALGQFEQTYFANSPAEQAYARQLYTEIATRMGQSSKFPVAREISRAMMKRLGEMQQAETGAASNVDTQTKATS